MTWALGRRRISVEQSFAAEAGARERHEWLDGTVYLTGAGGVRHAMLCASATAQLSSARSPWRPCSSDLRVRVPATGLITYPDGSVICGTPELDPIDPAGCTVTNPTVLVEVLSPSTADYDLDEKRLHHQQLPRVRTILLVAQDRPRVACYRRSLDGQFTCSIHGPGERVTLDEIGATLVVDELYRDLPPA